MDAIFKRLASVSRATVERVHGETITVYPITRPNGVNGKPALAPLEDHYETVACFYENTLAENESKSQPLTGHGKMLHRSLLRSASIRLVAGKKMATDFLIRRHSDDALFTITQFDPDGLGTVLAAVSVAKGLPPEA